MKCRGSCGAFGGTKSTSRSTGSLDSMIGRGPFLHCKEIEARIISILSKYKQIIQVCEMTFVHSLVFQRDLTLSASLLWCLFHVCLRRASQSYGLHSPSVLQVVPHLSRGTMNKIVVACFLLAVNRDERQFGAYLHLLRKPPVNQITSKHILYRLRVIINLRY